MRSGIACFLDPQILMSTFLKKTFKSTIYRGCNKFIYLILEETCIYCWLKCDWQPLNKENTKLSIFGAVRVWWLSGFGGPQPVYLFLCGVTKNGRALKLCQTKFFNSVQMFGNNIYLTNVLFALFVTLSTCISSLCLS
jgi:hypothetical protein